MFLIGVIWEGGAWEKVVGFGGGGRDPLLFFPPWLTLSHVPFLKNIAHALLPIWALTHSFPSVFSCPEFPNSTIRGNDDNDQTQPSSSAAILGGMGGLFVLIIGIALLIYFLRRRQRTFKGDYSTKKHVFGNGYSKAGSVPAHPTVPKNLQYPDDSDDEKKASQTGGPGAFEGTEHDFDGNSEDLKRPYFTVDEGESHDYDERTLAFQYEPESEIADDMVSQTDGSVISKKEWYV